VRTDNDTWDISTSVGATALFVAVARALETAKPEPLAVDPYAEVFCRAVGGHWAAVLDGTAAESKMLSDFGTHFVDFQGARTRYFDDFFADAAAAGVSQTVILAAGLDSRAYRLDWPTGTVIYELDQPEMLRLKREILDERGYRPRATRVEIAVDLRDDWPQALRDKGFDVSAPAAFLAEGLLVYLPASAQGDLFTGIDTLAAPGSFVGIEEGEPMPEEVFASVRAAEQANATDMTFFQLIYNQRIATATDWFGGRGWDATPTPLADHLTALGRPIPEPGTEAEPMITSITLVRAVKRRRTDR
jgi:methyltransferase (TIGR00027 family)